MNYFISHFILVTAYGRVVKSVESGSISVNRSQVQILLRGKTILADEGEVSESISVRKRINRNELKNTVTITVVNG